MAEIVVFGGTSEGRRIVEYFANTKLTLHICVATEYGKTLLPQADNIVPHVGRMDEEQIKEFLQHISPDCCIDATHPYAVCVTGNVKQACEQAGVTFVRIARDESAFDANAQELVYCDSVDEAATFLQNQNGNILIATGSKELEKYCIIEGYRNRCYARVLPTLEVMEKCNELGFVGRNLIGMQGPFSEEMNYCMLKQIDAKWMVTKDSGKEGGMEAKYLAANKAGVKLVVIGRPAEEQDAVPWSEAVLTLCRQYEIEKKPKIYLIGIGPGAKELLTQKAKDAIAECDVLIGAKRILDSIHGDGLRIYSYNSSEIMEFIEANPQYHAIGLCYSGDIGFYSGACGMKKLLSEYEVEDVSGISSVTYFLNKLGVAWDSVCLTSCHGREKNLIPLIRTNRYVCAILGDANKVATTCRLLSEYDFKDIAVTIGERLSYEDEKIVTKDFTKCMNVVTNPLSVVLFENPHAIGRESLEIKDDEFIRGKTPMTKSEIRTVSVAKLQLEADSIVYDIGAGTGSVSIAMARQCLSGMVYAIEKKSEAIELINANKKKFQVENLAVVEGMAPEVLDELEAPTHVFIGGSSGQLFDIVKAVRAKNPEARFVVNAISLETLGALAGLSEEFPEYEEMEIVQMQVSRAKKMGSYHLMNAENPVYIVSFGGAKNG